MKTISFESACINQLAFERVFFQKFRGGNTGRGRGRSAVCVLVCLRRYIDFGQILRNVFYALLFEQVVSVNCTVFHRGWP